MILTKTIALTLVVSLAMYASAQRNPRPARGSNAAAQALKQQIKNNILAKIANQNGVSTPAPNATNPSQDLAQAIRLKKLQEIADKTAAEATTASSTSSTSSTTPESTSTDSSTTDSSATTTSSSASTTTSSTTTANTTSST